MISSENGGLFKILFLFLKVRITKNMCAKFQVKIWLGSDFRQGAPL